MARGVWCALVLAAAAVASAQTPLPVEDVLARIGDRVAKYYTKAQSIVCTEESTVQPITLNYGPDGFARTVESELRVEADRGETPGDPGIVREVRKVNGRPPRARDSIERAGCTDPNPLSTEPLTFLLPAHRSEYRFKTAGTDRLRNRETLTIDFETVDRQSRAQLIEDKSGHEDCFDWTGPVATSGRIWVDPASYDVLQVERHNRGPLDVSVPWALQRRYHFDNYVVVERQDVTIRYRMIAFSEPEETLVLPESIDTVVIVRGGLQSTRQWQIFSDYRRFVTEGRVVK
jgi:hypothetical protein